MVQLPAPKPEDRKAPQGPPQPTTGSGFSSPATKALLDGGGTSPPKSQASAVPPVVTPMGKLARASEQIVEAILADLGDRSDIKREDVRRIVREFVKTYVGNYTDNKLQVITDLSDMYELSLVQVGDLFSSVLDPLDKILYPDKDAPSSEGSSAQSANAAGLPGRSTIKGIKPVDDLSKEELGSIIDNFLNEVSEQAKGGRSKQSPVALPKNLSVGDYQKLLGNVVNVGTNSRQLGKLLLLQENAIRSRVKSLKLRIEALNKASKPDAEGGTPNEPTNQP